MIDVRRPSLIVGRRYKKKSNQHKIFFGVLVQQKIVVKPKIFLVDQENLI